MSVPPAPRVDGEALDWALRMAEPDADWDAFLLWLEGDPGRTGRYDRAVAALDDAAATVATVPTAPLPAPPPAPANDDAPALPGPRRRGWIAGAVAAALAGAVGLHWWAEPRAQPYAVATGPGEQRVVALADGSSIALAGDSRVRLDRADPRTAALDRGEALFRVRHNDAQPFRVTVGDLALTDLGTVFDVRVLGGRTRVAVAEGAVMVDPAGARLRLDRGQAMVADGDTLRREPVDPADVGGWREGRLAYDGATLADVAADLSRHLGRPVAASPAVATRTFRGTIETRGLADDPALLGALLDVRVRADKGGWTLDRAR